MVRCGQHLAVAVLSHLGCAATQPGPARAVRERPEPAPCPREAVVAMAEFLGWSPGMEPYIRFIYDERQPGGMADPAIMKEGPVTGLLEEPYGQAPRGTRVDGHLWVNGNHLYGRYTRMHLAGGRTVPVCLEIDVVARRFHGEEQPVAPGEFRFLSAWHVMPVLSYMQDR